MKKNFIDFEEDEKEKIKPPKTTKMCFYLLQEQFAVALIMLPFQSTNLSCGDLVMNNLAIFILMFVW